MAVSTPAPPVHVAVDPTAEHDALWSTSTDEQWWQTGGDPPPLEPSDPDGYLTWTTPDAAHCSDDSLAAGLVTAPATATRPIEQICLGDRVIGENPDSLDVDPDLADPVAARYRRIAATVLKEDGTAVDIELLRPAAFVNALDLTPGSQLPLQLAELDVRGVAIVTEITASPTIQSGEGEVVTGRFVTRTAANRVRVTLSSGEELTATDVHPVWVPATATWTPAGELIPGTQLDTLHGPAEVTSVQPLSEVRSVYNIEVHRHHVYRGGNDGVLVHNSCPDFTPSEQRALQEAMDGIDIDLPMTGRKWYHGTDEGSAEDILQNGLSESRLRKSDPVEGETTPGFFLTDDINEASVYATQRTGDNRRAAVISIDETDVFAFWQGAGTKNEAVIPFKHFDKIDPSMFTRVR